MTGFEDRAADYQRRRWMRPNAHLWIRPDAYRWMPPGAPRWDGKDAVRYFWPEPECDTRQKTCDRKYDPNQSRVPAGNPDGGQWTNGGRSAVGRQFPRIAARRISPALEAQCEAQYKQDIFQCKMVGLKACYAQAALRYANCLAGLHIPPLNY